VTRKTRLQYKTKSLEKWRAILYHLTHNPTPDPNVSLGHGDCGYCTVYYEEGNTESAIAACHDCPLLAGELCKNGSGTAYRDVALYFESYAPVDDAVVGAKKLIQAIEKDIASEIG